MIEARTTITAMANSVAMSQRYTYDAFGYQATIMWFKSLTLTSYDNCVQ